MKKPRILYVEDEIFLAKIVSETLQARGFEIILDDSGEKAVEKFQNTHPDVCILDVMLPKKDGFTIADEIRERDEKVPIIFLTARSEVADVVNGFRIGGNDYLRKPFSMEELIVRIENLLRNKSGAAAEPEAEEVQLGSYSFNMRRQILADAAGQRKLSYRENELLKILYHNRDRVVERKDVLNLLWGSDSFFNSRNLDVYITKLRGYFKHDPSIEIITVKGVGYRFVLA